MFVESFVVAFWFFSVFMFVNVIGLAIHFLRWEKLRAMAWKIAKKLNISKYKTTILLCFHILNLPTYLLLTRWILSLRHDNAINIVTVTRYADRDIPPNQYLIDHLDSILSLSLYLCLVCARARTRICSGTLSNYDWCSRWFNCNDYTLKSEHYKHY